MRYLTIFPLLLACSSTTSTKYIDPPQEGGAGTSQGGNAGENNAGTAGNSGNFAGGNGGVDGGNAGSSGNAGSAGMVAGAGGEAGNNVGGSGGNCVPKNCVTIGVELGGQACGIVGDECGNYIDCGGCDANTNKYDMCEGLPAPNNDTTQNPSIKNICNGGCTKINEPIAQPYNYICTTFSGVPEQYKILYLCSSGINIAPNTFCFNFGQIDANNIKRYAWCC